MQRRSAKLLAVPHDWSAHTFVGDRADFIDGIEDATPPQAGSAEAEAAEAAEAARAAQAGRLAEMQAAEATQKEGGEGEDDAAQLYELAQNHAKEVRRQSSWSGKSPAAWSRVKLCRTSGRRAWRR